MFTTLLPKTESVRARCPVGVCRGLLVTFASKETRLYAGFYRSSRGGLISLVGHDDRDSFLKHRLNLSYLLGDEQASTIKKALTEPQNTGSP